MITFKQFLTEAAKASYDHIDAFFDLMDDDFEEFEWKRIPGFPDHDFRVFKRLTDPKNFDVDSIKKYFGDDVFLYYNENINVLTVSRVVRVELLDMFLDIESDDEHNTALAEVLEKFKSKNFKNTTKFADSKYGEAHDSSIEFFGQILNGEYQGYLIMVPGSNFENAYAIPKKDWDKLGEGAIIRMAVNSFPQQDYMKFIYKGIEKEYSE